MRRRTAAAIVTGAIALPLCGLAFATPPSGLTSELLVRGTTGEFRIHDEHLKVHANRPTDVAIVRATLQPRGSTGWHRHPGHSIVVVKSGAITMYEPNRRDGCDVQTFGPGSAFAHPEDEHTFVNETQDVAEFYVVYLVPKAATPLLNDVSPAPAPCP